MNFKLNTASLVLGDREVLFDRNIARQLPVEYGEYLVKSDKVVPIGTITLCEEREWNEWVLLEVNGDVRRMPRGTYVNCGFAALLGQPRTLKRIILP